MNFWKTSFWATLATMARLLSQFVVAKLVAVFAGAATFGIIGQFQSFTSLIQLGSGGIVSGGVTKYTSEYHQETDKLDKLIHTAIKFAFLASLGTGLIIIIFSKWLALFIFQNQAYWWLVAIFGATLFGYTLNQMFLSVFNGLNEMRKYASMAMIGAIFSVVLIGSLTYFYHTEGALLGLVLSPICLFCVGIAYIHRVPAQIQLFKAKIDPDSLKKLLTFSLMAITSAIALPVAQMIIRVYVADHSSWAEVGYWQAILRISNAYLLIITTVIGTYALPKYARITDNMLLKKEVFSVMVKVVPAVALLALGIYLLRHWIIVILFSPKFFAMEPLFAFQLAGDVIKIASWVMANVLLAKAQVKVYMLFEIAFTLSFCCLSLLGFEWLGIRGLTLSFCINYIGYFFIVLVWFWRFVR